MKTESTMSSRDTGEETQPNLGCEEMTARKQRALSLETAQSCPRQRQQDPGSCLRVHSSTTESQTQPHPRYSLGQVLATLSTQALHDNRVATSFQPHQKCPAKTKANIKISPWATWYEKGHPNGNRVPNEPSGWLYLTLKSLWPGQPCTA